MRRQVLFIPILALVMVATALAQDNPILPLGAPYGGNNRPHVYRVPYIFGNGCNIVVKWKQDLSVAPYATRRNAWHNITFDEQGFLYFRGAGNAELGIHKADPATGNKIWWSAAVPDTAFSTQSAIVGSEAVYAARNDPGNPTVYALNKATGVPIWESAPLPMPVLLNMALYDGVLYGTTARDANGNNHAFAINAATGVIMHATPYPTSGDNGYYNAAFAPDVFDEGVHGLYWFHNDNGDLGEAIYGVQISNATAAKAWSSTPIRAYGSNAIYNPDMNAVYALHWADYGTAVECYDPVTGAIRWTAAPNGDPTLGFPGGFNGGFYKTHPLKPDGSGFVFAGFGHDVYSVTDPGDLGGGALNYTAHGDWYYDGLDILGESQTCAVLIVDPVTNAKVFVSGTTAAYDDSDPNNIIDEPRRLFAMNVPVGSLIWEWVNPGDVNPYDWSFNFRALSVGPDGTLYYQDAAEPPGGNGTLYAITSNAVPGDVDCNLVVNGLDLTAVITAWQTKPGDALWNPKADLDVSGVVDGLDLTAVISNWTIPSSAAPEESEAAKPGKRLGNVRKGR